MASSRRTESDNQTSALVSGGKCAWEGLCESILTDRDAPPETSSWLSWVSLFKETLNYRHDNKRMHPGPFSISQANTNRDDNRRFIFQFSVFNIEILTACNKSANLLSLKVCFTI